MNDGGMNDGGMNDGGMDDGGETPPPRVGIVVVSHSAPLAEAAIALATEMVAEDPPAMVMAAGTADGGTGTDATAVAAAIEKADAGAGVVALLDLGSAIMSAEMALEFLSGDIDVRLVPAPFVEGLVAAAVRAAAGAGIDEVVREAADALSPKIAQLGTQVGGQAPADESGDHVAPRDGDVDARGSARIVNLAGLHARPAAAIAAVVGRIDAQVWVGEGGTWADASSPTSLAGLASSPGAELDIVAQGPSAQQGVDAVVALVGGGFGEELAPEYGGHAVSSESTVEGTTGGEQLSRDSSGPMGVSEGRGVGPVLQAPPPPLMPTAGTVPEAERAAERERIGPACAEVSRRLRQAAQRMTGDGAAILEATAAIAADPALSKGAIRLCDEGRTAETAVWEAAGALAASLTKAGGVIAERATDVLDVRDRVVAVLEGKEPGFVHSPDRHVLVAHDLAPADAVELDPATCVAIITEGGSPTSHTAIIAREKRIPFVVGARGATSIPPGTIVIVDGGTGEWAVEPGNA